MGQAGYRESGSTATFQHTYSSAGTYTITFTVSDSMGAQTESTVTTTVTLAPSVLTMTTWGEPEVQDIAYGLYAKPLVNGQIPNQNTVMVTTTVIPPTGDPLYDEIYLTTGMNSKYVNQGVYAKTFGNTMPCGTYAYTVKAQQFVGGSDSVEKSGSFVLSSPYCKNSNQPPVITGGSAPESLMVNQQGTWSVSAYDPDGTYLSYSVIWGDEAQKGLRTANTFSSTATFQHTYTSVGAYTITFIVKDASGATTQSTSTVNVLGGIVITSCTDSDSGQDLFVKGTGKGNYIGSGGPVIIGLGSTPWFAQSSPYPYSVFYDYCDQSGQIIEAFCDANGNLSATGSSCPSNSICSDGACVKNNSLNQPPVITSLSNPTSLNIGQVGTWSITANDPDGTYLSYSVNWGESITITPSTVERIKTGNSASFQHAYSQAGTYRIVFTVTDSAGAQTESATTVKVTDSASIGEIYASVDAIPTELYQYDSVYVTGKVTRGAAANHDIWQSKNYVAVLTLDNGNVVRIETVIAGQSGNIISNQGSTTVVPSQGKEEEITLAPGESREVSAYFTASQLGTNFAKVMVYEKIGVTCTSTDEDHAENNGCQYNYKLVASDSVKVQVKQGGDIPNPPSEKITLKFEKGWNQVSVPTGYDVSLSDIQKKCDITSAWSYNTALGQYSAATVFGREITGAWMKANAACTYELDAPYVATGNIPLKTGWNMIGAPSQATAISNFAGSCKITSGPWNYSPSASQYGYSEKLEPGKGYWVKVSADCTMGSASDSMPPAAPTN